MKTKDIYIVRSAEAAETYLNTSMEPVIFESDEEAIEFAMNHKDELAYVEWREYKLEADGTILANKDPDTAFCPYDESSWINGDIIWGDPEYGAPLDWYYDDEEDEEDEEEDGWAVCVVELDTSDSDWVYFDSEQEAVDYYYGYDYKTNVEVQLYDPETMVKARRIKGRRIKEALNVEFEELVERLEENEDVVECKECFELFPKEECTKLDVGYVCPHCHKEIDDETTSSEPEIILVDDVAFSIDFPDAERFEEPDEWEVVNIESEEPTVEPMPEIGPNPEPVCVGPECEAPVEAPVTKEETVATLVKDEQEAIEGYDKAAVEIEANPELTEEEKEEALEVIEHIKEEELEHIEELAELVDTKEEESENDPISEVEDQVAEEEVAETLTEDITDLGHSIANFFQKGGNAIKNLFHKGVDVLGGSKFHLDDYYSPDGKNNKDHAHGNGYKVYGYTEKQEKVQEQKFNKLGDAYEYALELSKALGVKALSVIEIVEYKDEGKPILAIFKDGSLTEKTKNIIIDKANKLSEEETQADRQKAHQEKADALKAKGTPVEEPKEEEKKPTEEEETKPGEGDELVHATGPADSGKGALLNQRKKGNQKIITALKDAGFDVSDLIVDYKDKSGKNRKKASDKLNALRKAILGEDLVEHVNEEHPAIESEQELEGTDNAIVDCKVADVITHSEDEKPLNCEMKDKPLEKPLTEEIETVLTEKEFAQMETYLKGGKYRSLDTEWTKEYDADHHFAIDEIGAYLDYNTRINMFTLGLSVYHASEDNNAEYPERHTDEDEFSYDSLAEMYEDEDCKEILDRIYKDNSAKLSRSISEETHAKYAKPAGDRVQAYNNALKYAKKAGKPYIYGYSQIGDGKFFALEQPVKVSSTPAEAEKEFKNRYKRCSVVYMVYPDKDFVESLEEASYRGFAYYEYPVGSKCHVRETPTSFVATNENGTTIGESRTKIGAEGIIDEYLKTSIKEELFTKAEQEEYNMDEDGNSLDSYDTYIRCGFCDEIYTKSECKYERNLSWLCPSCEAAIYSRGEKLTFVDPDEFLD